MTVRELIKTLSEYDPDLEVKAPTNEYLLSTIDGVSLRPGRFVEIRVKEV